MLPRLDNYQRRRKIVVVSPPASEPVTLAELKTQMRVDFTDDDTLITSLGVVARELFEAYTGRRLITRSEQLWLDSFPPVYGLMIPAAPVTAVTSLKYYDSSDVEYVYDPTKYTVSLNGPVAELVLKIGSIWPILGTLIRLRDAVCVSYTVGYADAAHVPESIKAAIKLLAAHLYENREATTPLTLNELPLGLKNLMQPHRVWEALA